MFRNLAVLDLLLQYGAKTDFIDSQGSGILHWAAYYGSLEMIEALRDAKISGIDTNALDGFGMTPQDTMTARMPGYYDKPEIFLPREEEHLAFKLLLDEIDERNKRIVEDCEDTGMDGEASEWSSESDETGVVSESSGLFPLGRSDCVEDGGGSDDDFFDATESFD
ncbi:hypothetical protein QQX98_002470 [Neonectria punicea]|uniref:Uncharacterized protein n=1 Tax=Neonectria punicea TaxID=979145 RepID=A0ABR1HI90_9HYPO